MKKRFVQNPRYDTPYWQSFNRNHRWRQYLMAAFIVAYLCIGIGLRVLHSIYPETPRRTIYGALCLVVGVGGWTFLLYCLKWLFMRSYLRWAGELGTLLEQTPAERTRWMGMRHFIGFVLSLVPTDYLQRTVLYMQEYRQRAEQRARDEVDARRTEHATRVSDLKRQLTDILAACVGDEADQLRRTVRRTTDLETLRGLVPRAEAVRDAPVASTTAYGSDRDVISDLESEYEAALAEARRIGCAISSEATAHYDNVWRTSDRKKRRQLLTQAIGEQRKATRAHQIFLEKAAAVFPRRRATT